MSDMARLESLRELSDRYLTELQELVDQGEISAAVAQQIMDDLFEPAQPGQRPMVRWSIWCAQVEESLAQPARIRLPGFGRPLAK